MPKIIEFRLSETELSQIEQVIKTSKSSRLVKRATGIRMLHFGHSSNEVGRVLLVSAPTIYSWFHRWKAEGLKGLENRPEERTTSGGGCSLSQGGGRDTGTGSG